MSSRALRVSVVVRAPGRLWVRGLVRVQPKVETRSAADVADKLRRAHFPVQSAWRAAFRAVSRATRHATIAAANAPHSVRHR